uniref:ADAM_spacer1 domain-containing protein n=1 Tax=Macrostomum lignano TaxID=282301 RepID=A0A1I8IXG3_9PLAT
TLRRNHLTFSRKFEDPEFPLEAGPGIDNDGVEWLRPSELAVGRACSRTACRALMWSAASAAPRPATPTRTTAPSFHPGILQFEFGRQGRAYRVVVDDRLPSRARGKGRRTGDNTADNLVYGRGYLLSDVQQVRLKDGSPVWLLKLQTAHFHDNSEWKGPWRSAQRRDGQVQQDLDMSLAPTEAATEASLPGGPPRALAIRQLSRSTLAASAATASQTGVTCRGRRPRGLARAAMEAPGGFHPGGSSLPPGATCCCRRSSGDAEVDFTSQGCQPAAQPLTSSRTQGSGCRARSHKSVSRLVVQQVTGVAAWLKCPPAGGEDQAAGWPARTPSISDWYSRYYYAEPEQGDTFETDLRLLIHRYKLGEPVNIDVYYSAVGSYTKSQVGQVSIGESAAPHRPGSGSYWPGRPTNRSLAALRAVHGGGLGGDLTSRNSSLTRVFI